MKTARQTRPRESTTRIDRPGRSSVVVVVQRKIPEQTRLDLFVRAGGRCEFDGCNRFLLEHHLTLTRGNFGQLAHIVAFSTGGPRGSGDERRPLNINDANNLMLLCPQCHKLIDDHPKRFTRETLRAYKSAHEDRIRLVTGLGPERKTAVLILKALIGGQTVSVPFDQLAEATAPRYPTALNPFTIDLTAIPGADSTFYKTACRTIAARLDTLLAPEGAATRAGHLSVFALAPIPLLICLGRQLTSKVPSDIFQRHRDPENWTWKSEGEPVSYRIRRPKRKGGRRVALVLSLSGTISTRQLPPDVRKTSAIYEITLNGQTPRPTFLEQKRDLDAFRVAYLHVISEILRDYGLIRSIDLFSAIPAPVAVLCGRELLPKVHPKLRVFDYDQAAGGFQFVLEI